MTNFTSVALYDLSAPGCIFVWGFNIKGGPYFPSTWCNIMKHQLCSQDIIIAKYSSQGVLLPTITASIDLIDRNDCPLWMTTEICDNFIAIDSFYRSTTQQQEQQIWSSSTVFAETKFIHIKQLRKSSYIWSNEKRLLVLGLFLFRPRNNETNSSYFIKSDPNRQDTIAPE